MKTLKTLTAAFGIFALMMGSAFATENSDSANETSKSNVGILTNVNANRVVVALENDGTQDYWVAIEDADGNTLHSEVVTETGTFNKRYDFAELADGEYAIKVGRGNQVTSQEVVVKK